jgi:hypothetical protein
MFQNGLKLGLVSSGLCMAYNHWENNMVHLEGTEEKKKKIIRYQPFNTENLPPGTILKPKLMTIKREPRTFFEKPLLEAMSKVSIYHLVGFIGYLPYVSDILHYLVIPSLPFNAIGDGFLFYSLWKNEKKVDIFNQSYNTKEYAKMVDYMSWAFAFVSAGGSAKGLPPMIGMIISMYLYTRIRKDKYNKYEAILAGATGATIAQGIVMSIAPFYIGRVRKIPFSLGIFLTYGAFSSFLCYLINVYIEGKNDEKLSSSILSAYKWTYLNMFALTNLTKMDE